MQNVIASIVGIGCCFAPILAEVDATSVEGLIQNGAYGAGAGILVWQLIKSYKRNDELQQKNSELQEKIIELTEKMMHRCGNCDYVRENKELAKLLHRETVEHFTGEYDPKKGRLQ